MKNLLLILLVFWLQSCSPSFQKGGWVAVALAATAGIWFLYRTILISFTLRVPVRKVNEFMYAIALLAAAVVIYLAMYMAR